MKKLILMMGLLILVSAAPRVMALDQTSQAIERAWKEQVAQQKQQEAKWKALEAEMAKSFEHVDKSTGSSKKKSK